MAIYIYVVRVGVLWHPRFSLTDIDMCLHNICRVMCNTVLYENNRPREIDYTTPSNDTILCDFQL